MAESGAEQTQPIEREQQEAKVKIARVSASSEVIIPREKITDTQAAKIAVAGDTTVVLNADSDQVKLYDDQGNEVELPDTPLMITDWEQLGRPSEGDAWVLVRNVIDIPPGAVNFLTLDSLDPSLQASGQKLLARNAQVALPTESWKIDHSDLNKVRIDVDSDAVTIYQPGTDSFIAFKTKDVDGRDLPPRNWQRIDTDNGDAAATQSILNRLDYIDEPEFRSMQLLQNESVVVVNENGLVIKQQTESHRENLPHVENNITEDPNTPGLMYFCAVDGSGVYKIDTNQRSSMYAQEIPFPTSYPDIHNLRMDNSSHFLTFSSGDRFVIVDKNTLEEIKTDTNFGPLYHAALDEKNQIKGIDQEGHLVTYSTDFTSIIQQKRREEVEAASRQAVAALDPEAEAARRRDELEQRFAHLSSSRDTLKEQMERRVTAMTTTEDFVQERRNLQAVLDSMPLNGEEKAYMQTVLEDVINNREQIVVRELFTSQVESLTQIVELPHLDMTNYAQAGELIAELTSLKGRVTDTQLREQLATLQTRFEEKEQQFKREQNESIRTSTQDIIRRAKVEIDALRSKRLLADWAEGDDYASLRIDLGNLRDISIPENYGIIDQAQRDIVLLMRSRREAIEEMEALTGTTPTELRDIQLRAYKDEITGFLDTLRDQSLQNRTQIDSFLAGSGRFGDLVDTIDELVRTDPEMGRTLRRELGVSLALYTASLERSTSSGIDGDERPMVLLGDTRFPIWQERRKSHRETAKKVDITFIADTQATKTIVDGKPVTIGDVGIKIKNGKPDTILSRLFQGKENEDEWRIGSVEYFGEFTPGTTVTNTEFNTIKRDFGDWDKGPERSTIRQTLKELKDQMNNVSQERPVQMADGSVMTKREAQAHLQELRGRGETPQMISVDTKNGGVIEKPFIPAEGEATQEWEDQYQSAKEAYAQFAAEKHVLLFDRIDKLRNAPDTEEPSSMGYVPEWRSHWTIDEQTSLYLGEIAKEADMQLKIGQGIINLEGHAGTGKDVLVKMFCHETKRGYFAFDCTKWTVESDLSEDITLENGSIVKIPSIILQAIQTPGAVLYLNELNAMPESSQIFLHSLLDEKQTLTLKTSAGKSVRKDPTVILMSSMNPNYPGTFDPQFATKSRMDYVEIDYPPLRDPADATKFNSSEALRIARGIKSLEEYTYDLDLNRNGFVKIWNKYVNHESNDAPPLTPEQQFDLRTILALVQFTDQLRTGFTNKFENRRGGARPFTIAQPMTGRELAKCAFDLSEMSDDAKVAAGADPVATAKAMIDKRLLTKLKATEREEVQRAMASWTLAA